MNPVFRFISFLLGLGWIAFMLATPLLGVWLASSLISLHGGPRELALIGGVLLFPVLPVVWELRAARRWKQAVARRRQLVGKPPTRTLKTLDRLVLRTLALNLLFIAVLLVWFPKTAFAALATRGDWFLGERQEPWARDARRLLFASASGLEWLHELANPNPYKKAGDDAPVPSNVVPVEQEQPPPTARESPVPPVAEPDAGVAIAQGTRDAGVDVAVLPPVGEPVVAQDAAWRVGDTVWPHAPQVHPVVAAMTAADEASIDAVGRHIAARETEPFQRVKALHDWVVTRLQYDTASLDFRNRKPQDAQSVFTSRLGVCEGYARLMVELGKAAGDRVVFVVGDVREESGEAAAVGHAWNAVEIKGKWYLVDATWDDPLLKGQPRADTYQTDYLFIPPSVAVFDHLPEDDRWQLLARPLSRGEFLRQPFARPGLAREGLTLVSPERSSVEVRDALELTLENPRHLFVSAQLSREGSSDGQDCGVSTGEKVTLRCPVASPGRYTARLFTNRERFGVFNSVAAIDVLAR